MFKIILALFIGLITGYISVIGMREMIKVDREGNYMICWIRLGNSHVNVLHQLLTHYSTKPYPQPLALDGSGLQYVFAVEESQVWRIIKHLKLLQHEVKSDLGVVKIDGCGSDFRLSVQHDKSPRYFIERISSDER